MTTNYKDVNDLVPVVGKWDLSAPERPIYQAPQAEFGWPCGICISSVQFVEGEARVTVKMPRFKKESDTSGRFLIGYKGRNAPYFLAGIGGNQFAYSLYRYDSGVWQPSDLCGSGDNIVPDKPYNISVHIKGQRLIFKQDDTIIFDHLLTSPLPAGQLGLFTWGKDPVEFTNLRVSQNNGSAFVVMKFAEPYLDLYNEVIKPAATGDPFKLNVYHAGEAFGRVILQDIIKGLEEARVVIAEITPENRNVFYELGYAHALRKDAILLVDKGSVKDLPFDIKGYRCIVYENTIVGKRNVQTELENHLKSILWP